MKTNQQNEKLNTLLRTTIMCLLVLTGTMQMHAIDYTPYKPGAYQEQTFPVATFQSTSAYASDEWSQSTTPMLNADGSVSAGAYMGGENNAPRRAPGTPGGNLNPDDQQTGVPIGNALLPLLLMMAAFCLIRRKEMI